MSDKPQNIDGIEIYARLIDDNATILSSKWIAMKMCASIQHQSSRQFTAVIKFALLLRTEKNINYIQLPPNMWASTKLFSAGVGRRTQEVRTKNETRWYNYSCVIINIVISLWCYKWDVISPVSLSLSFSRNHRLFMNLSLNWLLLILNKF